MAAFRREWVTGTDPRLLIAYASHLDVGEAHGLDRRLLVFALVQCVRTVYERVMVQR